MYSNIKKIRIRMQCVFLICSMLITLFPSSIFASDIPSAWAASSIEKAVALNLVPDMLRSNYQASITRAEYCHLIYRVISKEGLGISYDIESPFTDVDDAYVSYIAQYKIVAGIGNGKFAPNDTLSRQQAAVMLTNAAKYLGRDISKDIRSNFHYAMKDSSSFATWAVDSIAWVRHTGIMVGTSNDIFAPNDFYTREQAIITVLKLYDIVVGKKEFLNFKNYIVSSVPVTINNNVFSMDIPANAPYHSDIEKKVLNYCDWVQRASGMSFNPPGTSFEKIKITNDGGGAYGGFSGINIENTDYILDAGFSEYVYLHELSHVLQYRLTEIDCQPFVEAFAILNSAKAAKNQGLDGLYWHLISYNFSNVDASAEKAIISSDFENFYRTNEEGWDNYLYGFRFGVYLETKYGSDIFTAIIKNYAAKVESGSASRDEFVDFLKAQTNANVFSDFVDWYWKNKTVFDQKPFAALEKNKVIYMPVINKFYQGFPHDQEILMNEAVTFEFNDSHAYAQFQEYEVKGISGNFFSTGTVTVKSYDKDGNPLETTTIKSNDSQNLTFANATSLVVTGGNCRILFKPDFESCYSK